MSLKAVLFDLDGTVVENSYDWPRIRRELGAKDKSILSYLAALPEPQRSRKWAVLERHESEQTARSVLREGAKDLLAFLHGLAVKTALVTNNSGANTAFLLGKFGLAFDLVITRESGLWKPSGAAFKRVLEVFGVGGDECCVIGDTRFDVLAAMDAGVGAIFILTTDPGRFAAYPVEVYRGFREVRQRLEEVVAMMGYGQPRFFKPFPRPFFGASELAPTIPRSGMALSCGAQSPGLRQDPKSHSREHDCHGEWDWNFFGSIVVLDDEAQDPRSRRGGQYESFGEV